MFDLGMMEILVIGVVALIVVGPKDLPGLFRTVGKFVGKLKGMAREFQRSMDDAGRASGMSDVMDSVKTATDGVKKATSFNPLDFNKDLKSMAKDSIKKSTLLDDDAKEKALKKVDAEADKTAKKPAEKKVAKKPAAKSPVVKKPAAKKPAAKKAAPKKPTAKKTAPKKPAKKTTIKKDA